MSLMKNKNEEKLDSQELPLLHYNLLFLCHIQPAGELKLLFDLWPSLYHNSSNFPCVSSSEQKQALPR